VISPALDEVYDSLFAGAVPDSWHCAYPSLKGLGPWVKDLCLRLDQVNYLAVILSVLTHSWQIAQWTSTGPPKVFWLGGFTFPTGFLTALLQCTARRNNIAIDDLSWEFIPMAGEQAALATGPKEGAYIGGMFLEGARWDLTAMTLADANPMELEAKMPIVHFKPVDNRRGRYSPTHIFS